MIEKVQGLNAQLFGNLLQALNVRKVNCIERLEKINQRVNELVDLLMRWNRGDDEALQVLETDITTKKVRGWKDIQWLKGYKFTEPRTLATTAMDEIGSQLKLQREIFETLYYDIKTVARFQTKVLEVIGKAAPSVKDTIMRSLDQGRLVH
jgi:hypothetical protein